MEPNSIFVVISKVSVSDEHFCAYLGGCANQAWSLQRYRFLHYTKHVEETHFGKIPRSSYKHYVWAEAPSCIHQYSNCLWKNNFVCSVLNMSRNRIDINPGHCVPSQIQCNWVKSSQNDRN